MEEDRELKMITVTSVNTSSGPFCYESNPFSTFIETNFVWTLMFCSHAVTFLPVAASNDSQIIMKKKRIS